MILHLILARHHRETESIAGALAVSGSLPAYGDISSGRGFSSVAATRWAIIGFSSLPVVARLFHKRLDVVRQAVGNLANRTGLSAAFALGRHQIFERQAQLIGVGSAPLSHSIGPFLSGFVGKSDDSREQNDDGKTSFAREKKAIRPDD